MSLQGRAHHKPRRTSEIAETRDVTHKYGLFFLALGTNKARPFGPVFQTPPSPNSHWLEGPPSPGVAKEGRCQNIWGNKPQEVFWDRRFWVWQGGPMHQREGGRGRP